MARAPSAMRCATPGYDTSISPAPAVLSWVRVESLRATMRSRRLGEVFSGWGIPTAAVRSAMLRGSGLDLIASGGLRTGLEMAKAIALGARLCGAALPIYRAYRESGIDGAVTLINEFSDGLKAAMLLTGHDDRPDLSHQPLVMGERLKAWIAAVNIRQQQTDGDGHAQ